MKKRYDSLLIFVILGLIFATNFTPGTWLAGWDNLIPELNIGMNLRRSFSAAWQEYQGLGLVGGMAHATDFVRQLILLPFVLLLPNNLIRYLWHFAMLAMGTMGVYWGLGPLKRMGRIKEAERTLGGLLYLLNLGTIQYFWPPYEPFSTFWGFFPWLIFSFWQFLQKPNKKNSLIFILVNLLATPSFYVPTLFVAYLLCLIPVSLCHFLHSGRVQFTLSGVEGPTPGVSLPQGKTRIHLRGIFKAFFIILIINAFWLLPFAFFLASNVHHSQLSLTHLMTSQETFLRNQKRGTISDFLLLRGYYYDFPDGEKPLMEPWLDHFSNPWALGLGYLLGGLAIVGIFASFLPLGDSKRDNRDFLTFKYGVLGIWGIGAIALLSATPPFSWINFLLRQSPFLNQAFRSPFTKFIVPAAFSFSILSMLGVRTINQFFQKTRPKLSLVVCPLVFFALIAFSLPVFRGNFIYPEMRVKIPDEYFELIKFFKQQPNNARIANLPQGSFWGWTFYRWGLRGSGFLWYGVEQPILDRAFDVWSLKNEQYFWELNYALQRKDPDLLEQVLEKYSVEFVIFDDNIYFPGEKEYAKLTLKTKGVIEQSPRLKKLTTFGKIDIYKFDRKTRPYLILGNLPVIYPLSFTQRDDAFQKNGDYLVSFQNPDTFYPFGELFTNRLQPEINFEIKETDSFWQISRELPAFLDESYQVIIDSSLEEVEVPAEIDFDSMGEAEIEEVILLPEEFTNPHHCAPEQKDAFAELQREGEQLVLKAKNAALCVDWANRDFFENIVTPVGIEIEFEYQSLSNEWPQYCFWSLKKEQCSNNKDFPPKGFAPNWEKLSEKLIIDPNEDQIVNLSLILDGYRQLEQREIRYRNIKMKVYHFEPKEFTQFFSKIYKPEVEKATDKLTVSFPKFSSPWVIENPFETNLFKLQPKRCNPTMEGAFNLEVRQDDQKEFARLTSQNSDSCLSWHFPQLPLHLGWLVEIDYRYRKGFPLLISGQDGQGKYKFFYSQLEKSGEWQKAYFMIPPYSETEKGIAISFSSASFNQSETVNDVGGLKIIPLPWDYLKAIRFEKGEKKQKAETFPLESKSRLWLHSLFLPVQMMKNSPPDKRFYLVFPQSFDTGWVAINWVGKRPKLLRHILINNWANGWEIEISNIKDQKSKIHIVFWPQLLQYFGFLLLLGVGFWLARKKF